MPHKAREQQETKIFYYLLHLQTYKTQNVLELKSPIYLMVILLEHTQTITIKIFPTLVLLQLLFLHNTHLHLTAQTKKQNKQKLNSSLSSLLTPYWLLILYTLNLSQIHSFNLCCYLNNLTGLSASIHSTVAFSTMLTAPF